MGEGYRHETIEILATPVGAWRGHIAGGLAARSPGGIYQHQRRVQSCPRSFLYPKLYPLPTPFAVQSDVQNSTGTVHFDISSNEWPNRLDKRGAQYKGNVTVVWDSTF